MINTYLGRISFAICCALCACSSEDDTIDITEQEFYDPVIDEMTGESLMLDIANGSFKNRNESIEEIANRLGLIPFPASDSLLSPDEIVTSPPPFSFSVFSLELDEEDQVTGLLPGLTDASLGDSVRGRIYQTGRYLFRFQESTTHRFVSVTGKLSDREITDAQGQTFSVPTSASARLYVEDEDQINEALGIKRTRMTFVDEDSNLEEQYPGLTLPPNTVATTDYRFDTRLADSLDDNVVNERRVRVLLSVSE